MTTDRIVHVVDDDAAVRRSLDQLLQAAGLLVCPYGSAAAFLEAAPRLTSGMVLLDIRMPGMDGLALQARLRELAFALPVVVMTGQGDVPTAVRAMKGGAVDFIEKPFNDDVLVRAIEAALARGPSRNRDREAVEAAQRLATLSPREHEVLEALVAGRPNKVIAFGLGISVRTVEVHRARMMHRLGTHHVAEAIRVAVMARLAPKSPRGPEQD